MNNIRIFEVTDVKAEYIDAVNRLLVQLSSSPSLFTAEQLEDIVISSSSHLFLPSATAVWQGCSLLAVILLPQGASYG